MVTEEPTNEVAHAGLMRLYALSGRRREALGQYERLREALYRELGPEPEAASKLLQQEIWTGAFPLAPLAPAGSPPQETPSATGAVRHNLPRRRDTFVGREREGREVRRLLAMTGLLTLTGAGGSGKTRLALEVAGGLVEAYPDGAWLVELAPLSDPVLVPQAVAGALGVREIPGRSLEGTIRDHLRRQNLLLVVDNCEHLVDPVARLVEALLEFCPRLRVLATSREPLGVRGEAVWSVPPLSLPDAEEVSSIERVTGTGAVRLFVAVSQCKQTGNFILCQTYFDEPSLLNEPVFELSCGTLYETSTPHREGIRWYSADGLLLRRFVTEDVQGSWSLSPTGGGPTVRFFAHDNWTDVYAIPGDGQSVSTTYHGDTFTALAPGSGVLFHIAGQDLCPRGAPRGGGRVLHRRGGQRRSGGGRRAVRGAPALSAGCDDHESGLRKQTVTVAGGLRRSALRERRGAHPRCHEPVPLRNSQRPSAWRQGE
jgi:hypothetical protein